MHLNNCNGNTMVHSNEISLGWTLITVYLINSDYCIDMPTAEKM